ncbi:unnamed protein product [Pleuronectes platessa]|uniref:Uncharacterized protein n=1 Tax=Pleuronectes platessa TaxID=8262 RepID=A0A9N7U8B9_PLEPL|nr:unnamed protein product [Pleuronectes platessa]
MRDSSPRGDIGGGQLEVHLSESRTEKDERGHICVDAASRVRPALREVTCQSGDCWEQGQGQHHRRQVARQWESKEKQGHKGRLEARGRTSLQLNVLLELQI